MLLGVYFSICDVIYHRLCAIFSCCLIFIAEHTNKNQTCLKRITLLLQLPRNMLCCYSCTTLTGMLANFRWQRACTCKECAYL